MMNFRSLRIAATTCAIFTGTLMPVTSSQAFIGGFAGYLGLDVEVGIDSATRDFLQGYPKEIREQAVIGATQIMDRSDVSIALVFKQGRDFLLLGKDVVVCTGVTIENIPRGFLQRLFGIRPNFTQLLKDEIEEVGEEASLYTAPAKLYERYVDVDNLGRDAYCLTLQGDLDQHSVLLLRTEVKTTGLLWKRMEGLAPTKENPVGCTTVRECYSMVSTTVDDSLSKALKQDKDRIRADERMARIVRPPEPKSSWGSSNFDLRTYELALLGMLAIHDDLVRVGLKRTAKGTEENNKLLGMMKRNDALLREAEGQRDRVAGCNQAYRMIPQFQEATAQLEVVKGYEVLAPDAVAGAANQLQGLEGRRATLAAFNRGGVINNGRSCSYRIIPIFPRLRNGVF